MAGRKPPQIPLPKSWKTHVRSAMLNVVSLAQYAAVYSRSWAVDSRNGRVRLKADKGRLLEELSGKNEEIRINDARMARIAPQPTDSLQPNRVVGTANRPTQRGHVDSVDHHRSRKHHDNINHTNVFRPQRG